MFRIFFSSAAIAFFPYLACELFSSNKPHGLLCFDAFLILLLLNVSSKGLLKRTIGVLGIFVLAYNQNDLSSYILAFSYLPLFFVLPLITSKNKKRVVFVFLMLIIFLSDCSGFFYNTFALNMSDVWGISKFFWWGILLFIAVPLLFVLYSFFISNFVFRIHPQTITYTKAFAACVCFIAIHYLMSTVQSRQPIIDFPVKEAIDRFCSYGKASNSSILREDVKNKHQIFGDHDFSVNVTKSTVMILMESWGVNKDLKNTDLLFSPYRELKKARLGIMRRNKSFTQGAELDDFHDEDNTSIPQKMKREGFTTFYLHGYDGDFYKRESNYREYGFDSLFFKKDFAELGLNFCSFGFNGVCDESIVSFVDSLLNKKQKVFVYWTTLDAHALYETQVLNQTEKIDQCEQYKFSDVECVFYSRQINTAKKIVELIKKHPEVDFIIRGDHRPPGSWEDTDFISSFYYLWVPAIIVKE